VRKSMIPRELKAPALQNQISKRLPPLPCFVQVFILMSLGLTIGASCASSGFVGEEKTPGGQSGADSAVSRKPNDSRVRREAEVWLRANICDYNREVLIHQLLFTI
jgi:hypothetical protein